MIKKEMLIALATSLFLLGSAQSFADDRSYGNSYGNRQLVLNAKGVGTAYLCEIPPTALGTTTSLCFDISLINLKTGNYVGTLTSSLADVVQVDPNEPSRLFATITSLFQFTEWPGQPKLTARGPGSVQPFTGGSPTMTHMTGSIPSPGDNNILSGTGHFTFATGTVRESGAINLSVFREQPGDKITFDLLFVVTLN